MGLYDQTPGPCDRGRMLSAVDLDAGCVFPLASRPAGGWVEDRNRAGDCGAGG